MKNDLFGAVLVLIALLCAFALGAIVHRESVKEDCYTYGEYAVGDWRMACMKNVPREK